MGYLEVVANDQNSRSYKKLRNRFEKERDEFAEENILRTVEECKYHRWNSSSVEGYLRSYVLGGTKWSLA
jgi:hypothetical protein